VPCAGLVEPLSRRDVPDRIDYLNLELAPIKRQLVSRRVPWKHATMCLLECAWLVMRCSSLHVRSGRRVVREVSRYYDFPRQQGGGIIAGRVVVVLVGGRVINSGNFKLDGCQEVHHKPHKTAFITSRHHSTD
jgi:hypothetical protein